MKHNYSKSQVPTTNKHVSPVPESTSNNIPRNQENTKVEKATDINISPMRVSPRELDSRGGSTRSTSATILKQRIADYTQNNRPVSTRILQGPQDNHLHYCGLNEIPNLASKSFKLEDLSKQIESCLAISKHTLQSTHGVLSTEHRGAGKQITRTPTQTSEFDDNHRALKERYPDKYTSKATHPSVSGKNLVEKTAKTDLNDDQNRPTSELEVPNKINTVPAGKDEQPKAYEPEAQIQIETTHTHKLNDGAHSQTVEQQQQTAPIKKDNSSEDPNVEYVEEEQLHYSYNPTPRKPEENIETYSASEKVRKQAEKVVKSGHQSSNQKVSKVQKETKAISQSDRTGTPSKPMKNEVVVPTTKKINHQKTPPKKVIARPKTDPSENQTSLDVTKTAKKNQTNFIERNKLHNGKTPSKGLSPKSKEPLSQRTGHESAVLSRTIQKDLKALLPPEELRELGLTSEQIAKVYEKLHQVSRSTSPKEQPKPLNSTRNIKQTRSVRELKKKSPKRELSSSLERPKTEQEQKRKLTLEEQERLNNRFMAEAERRKLSKERALQEKIELEIAMAKAMANKVFNSSPRRRKSPETTQPYPYSKASFQTVKLDDKATPTKQSAAKPNPEKHSPESTSTIHKSPKKVRNPAVTVQSKPKENAPNETPKKVKNEGIRSTSVTPTPKTTDSLKTGTDLGNSATSATVKKGFQSNKELLKQKSPRPQTPKSKRAHTGNNHESIPTESLPEKKSNFMTKREAIEYVNEFLNEYKMKACGN